MFKGSVCGDHTFLNFFLTLLRFFFKDQRDTSHQRTTTKEICNLPVSKLYYLNAHAISSHSYYINRNTATKVTHTKMSKAPPQLHFDDGSRIITENAVTISSSPTTTMAATIKNQQYNPRGSASIHSYYEIGRIASDIVNNIVPNCPTENDNGFMCKVALQFPDELLDDAAEVSWLMEDAIMSVYKNSQEKEEEDGNEIGIPLPLIFVLGDTTYSSCCPDEIGALHLNADVIVHYGQYACLSPSYCLPVIYSFGVMEWAGMEQCINVILQHVESGTNNDSIDTDQEEEGGRKLLLLCERRYHQYMDSLALTLGKSDKIQEVIVGSVPGHNNDKKQGKVKVPMKDLSCCNSSGGSRNYDQTCCKQVSKANDTSSNDNCCNNSNIDGDESNSDDEDDRNEFYIGGLKIPIHPSSLPEYTLLYIGDDSGTSKSRQFLNTVLRCISSTNGTKECWSYNPDTNHLSIDPSSMIGISRFLNRRFFVTQKAQLSSIMGILVGTLSQDRFRNVISAVRKKIQDSGRGCYTFVVGKINVAKLANFAEVECFVLVSCGETSILKDERDFHVPVITPSELDIVLGEKVWGGSDSCNTDFDTFLKGDTHDDANALNDDSIDDKFGHNQSQNINENDSDDEEDDDEPFFSMISGTYVSKPIPQGRKQRKGGTNDDNKDAEGSNSGGQMVEYKSEAAEFWKKREYKGLEAKIGQTEVRAATKGQTGIASDYGK